MFRLSISLAILLLLTALSLHREPLGELYLQKLQQVTAKVENKQTQLTVLITTYKQPTCLNRLIRHFQTCPAVIKAIHVNWFEQDQGPPSEPLSWQPATVPVTFDRLPDALSYRFYPRLFPTEAVFTMDVDTAFSCESLQLALDIWNNQGDPSSTVVGFDPRNLYTNGTYKWNEAYSPPFAQNTLFVTKGAIVHRDVFSEYFTQEYKHFRDLIDHYITGEDMLMSFVLATKFHAKFITVCLEKGHFCEKSCRESGVVELKHRSASHRGELLKMFFDYFGTDTLTTTYNGDNNTMVWQTSSRQRSCKPFGCSPKYFRVFFEELTTSAPKAAATMLNSDPNPDVVMFTPPSHCPNASSSLLSTSPSIRRRHDMVVAIIALGGSKTIHELTYRCVNSIRRRGAWSGPIIVFVNRKIEDLQGLDDQQVTFVEITPKQQSEVTLLPGRMKYKRLKMDLIRQTDNMAQFRNMTYILYLDVDVVVGDSLDDFVSEQVAAMDKMYNISSPSFFWAFYQSTTRAHSGIMLLHRRFSRQCLEEWAKLVDTGNYTLDQDALAELVFQRRQQICRVERLPGDKLLFPTTETMQQSQRSTFVHVTNTKRVKEIDKRVQQDYMLCTLLIDEKYAVAGQFRA